MKEIVQFQVFFALINKLISLGSSGRKHSTGVETWVSAFHLTLLQNSHNTSNLYLTEALSVNTALVVLYPYVSFQLRSSFTGI